MNRPITFVMISDELPQEVVLSIRRVLEIQPTEEADRLDGLSEKFDAVEILNDFFPDGAPFSPFSPTIFFLPLILDLRGIPGPSRCRKR